jgi:hypothetical protein
MEERALMVEERTYLLRIVIISSHQAQHFQILLNGNGNYERNLYIVQRKLMDSSL